MGPDGCLPLPWGYKHVYDQNTQTSSFQKPLGQSKPNFMWSKIWMGNESCPPGSNWCFSFAPELVGYSAPRDLHRRAAYSICESLFLIHQDVYHDLFVCSLVRDSPRGPKNLLNVMNHCRS